MIVSCPGCKSLLNLAEDLFMEKVVVRCPECLQIFIARSEDAEEGEATGEATIMVSDRPEVKEATSLWRHPGASLTVVRGPEQGVHLRLKKDELIIGREEADLVLTDPAVSRWHARIFKEKGSYWIEDLGSTNGTFLNQKRIQKAELTHLDEIELGQTLMVFSEYGEQKDIQTPDSSQEIEELREDTRVSSPEEAHPLPREREFFLEVMTAPSRAHSYQIITSPFIIGRSREADLYLEDPEVSRKHCMIEVFGKESVYLSDLASANGTFLNGVRIRSIRLKHNDKIRVGQTVLKFVVKDLPDER